MSDKSVATQKKQLRSAPWLFAVLFGSAFFAELLVMFILPMLPKSLSTAANAILYAFFLIVLIFPPVYFLVFRPLVLSAAERQQSQETLSVVRGELEQTMNSMEEGIHRVDSQGNIVFENRASARMLAWPIAELLGRPAHLTMHHTRKDGASYPKEECPIYATLRDGISRHVSDEVFWRKDGTSFPVEYMTAPMRNDRNEIIAVVVNFRDTTERKRAEEALHAANEQLQMLVQSSPLAIYTRDSKGLLTSWNSAAEKMFGWKEPEVLGKPLPTVPDEERAASDANRMRLLAGESVVSEVRRRRRDGSPIDVDTFTGPLRDVTGKVNGIIAVVADITRRRQAEQALRESVEQLRLFADNVPAMTVSYDENLRCRFANKRFAEFFGFTPDSILGVHLREMVGEDAYQEIEGHFARALQGHPVTYHRTRKLASGESRYLEVKLLPHLGARGQTSAIFAVTADITEHRLAEDRIRTVAHHDALTGLPNRLLFGDRLTQALSLAKRDSRQFALLFLDLDKFKPVNDTLGHTAGDELLKGVAARIRQQVRESDTVARVGGDEFTVILPDIGEREEAETVAKKIVAALAAPFELGSQKQSVVIGISIGISVYPADGRDPDTLVNAADAAMYSAKQVGSSIRFVET